MVRCGPPEKTSFVGREEDLTLLSRTFADGARLVTITGPGGVGKTRFAIRFASSQLATFAEVRFCDLGEARSFDDVLARISVTLDSADAPTDRGSPSPPSNRPTLTSEILADALRQRGRVLLVLDNFEQVVAGAAAISVWLRVAPEARFLVTSREALAIAGEVRHELSPLGNQDAVRLFTQRAQDIELGRSFSGADLETVSEIVRKLDGIPLAIELAAARCSLFSLSELDVRLAERLDWLKSPRRDAIPRQATLQAAIDWSWRLLPPAEQHALCELAVFRAGFTMSAATAVISPEVDALDAVASLRNKSLIRTFDGANAIRLGLYESVREFALERLQDADRDASRTRHAAHFLGVCRARTPSELLVDEVGNLVAAHRWLLTHDPPASTEVLAALAPLLLYREAGPQRSYFDLVDETVRSLESAKDSAAFAEALQLRAEARRVRFERSEAMHDLEDALRIATKLGDEHLELRLRCALGFAEWQRGQNDQAALHGTRALQLARSQHSAVDEGVALALVGAVHWIRRDQGEMSIHLRRAVELEHGAGHRLNEGFALVLFASGMYEYGELGVAEGLFHRALATLREADSGRYQPGLLSAMGQIAFERGQDERARTLYEQALALARRRGTQGHEARTLARLGLLSFAAGSFAEGLSHLERAEGLATERGDRRLGLYKAWVASALASVGRHAEAASHQVRARALIGNSDDESQKTTLPIIEQVMALFDEGVDATTRERVQPALPSWSSDARAARRVHDSLSNPLRGIRNPPAPPEADLSRAILVGPEARWFEGGNGIRVDLARRKAPRLLLRALVHAHRDTPGRGLSIEDLFHHGWPGERASLLAAAHRVYTAINTLREMGLRDALIRRDDGYLLDDSVSVHERPRAQDGSQE